MPRITENEKLEKIINEISKERDYLEEYVEDLKEKNKDLKEQRDAYGGILLALVVIWAVSYFAK
jgi:hypothetical protein